MLKIGDFARLGQVSVVTLRHYDDCGLLHPIQVDHFTGYRYYSVTQLPRLNRIIALKDLGFSLDQIEQVLNGGITAEQLHGMLALKHAQVEQDIAKEQARLTRIAARLRQIELENAMSQYDVIFKTAPAITVVSRRITVPTNAEVPDYLGPAYEEVFAHIATHNTTSAGPNITIWHQAPDVYTNEVVEAIVPVNHPLPSTERIQVYTLPETQVASAVHHGEFADFIQLHPAILQWMETNGYVMAGGYREIYIKHDYNDNSDSITEVQIPVKPAS